MHKMTMKQMIVFIEELREALNLNEKLKKWQKTNQLAKFERNIKLAGAINRVSKQISYRSKGKTMKKNDEKGEEY